MSINNTFLNDLTTDQLCISVELIIPTNWSLPDFEHWANIVTEQISWVDTNDTNLLIELADYERLFIASFLKLSQLLLELGRLPIFSDPKVVSIKPKELASGQYLLELRVPLIQFIPHSAYHTPLKAALDLCVWMTQQLPTPENTNKVFTTIEEKVIKPLLGLVPAGKSTIPVLKVAHSLGIPFIHLGLGVYQLGWGSKARRLDRSTTELDSAIGARLSHNKVSTANLLRIAGLPAPVHIVVLTENDAIKAASRIGFPVVVKPSDKDRGEGVSVDISDDNTLKLAFTSAQKLSPSKQVIIERQVTGVCHRLFIVERRLLYAVKRLPMSVIGDGISTVKELVDKELEAQYRKPPWRRSEIKSIDDLALKTLSQASLTPNSIPQKDHLIALRPIESTEWGGVDEEVTNVIHPENLSVAEEAANLFGLHVAGIDIISPDITKPWYENGAIINEVNYAPLFGGGEISKSHIPRFFTEFIDSNGKIPLEAFAMEATALEKQAKFLEQGLACFFTSAIKTLDSTGKEIIMHTQDLKLRIKALICRSNVDAIVVHKNNS